MKEQCLFDMCLPSHPNASQYLRSRRSFDTHGLEYVEQVGDLTGIVDFVEQKAKGTGVLDRLV